LLRPGRVPLKILCDLCEKLASPERGFLAKALRTQRFFSGLSSYNAVVGFLDHYDEPGLDGGLDLQAASRRLVVVTAKPIGSDVRFDFHLFTSPFRFRLLAGGRRRALCFEAGAHCRSLVQARTGREIDQEERIFFDLRN
jgi:hypothetical protein